MPDWPVPGDPGLHDRRDQGAACMTVSPWRTRSSTIYQNRS